MQKTKYILLFSFLFFATKAQINLVPNPSFETHSNCPNNDNQLWFADGWKSFGYSPDYFNACATNPIFDVPYNITYQNSASGNSYAGLYTYDSAYPNFREFMGVKLISPLQIGTTYYINFKANLILDTFYQYNAASNGLGLKFTTYVFDSTSPPPLNNIAHVYSSTIITDTLGWVDVSGSFVADSSYEYVVLGNFFDSTNTLINVFFQNQYYPIAYYFIDDLYVSTLPLGAHHSYGNNIYHIYYSENIDAVSFNLSSYSKRKIRLIDITGKVLIEKNVTGEDNVLFLNGLSSGIYLFQIVSETESITRKIIKP